MAVPASILKELEAPYEVTKENIEAYQKNRFIKLKQVLSPEAVAFFNTVIDEQVHKMNTVNTDLSQRDTYGKAFLQLFNLWRENEDVKGLVFSKRLGKIAADLMQVEGVRMYHDQALVPLKALDFDNGVNVTLGLPIVRTSPDHGTAFAIAGKRVADAGATIAAIRMAGDIAARRANA